MSNAADLERWVYGPGGDGRFTQDSPVMPEVWLAYGEEPERRLDLLLTPHQHSSAARLLAALSECLRRETAEASEDRGLALNEGYVVARLTFGELVRCAVPLSPWWRRVWPPRTQSLSRWADSHGRRKAKPGGVTPKEKGFRADWLLWYLQLLGRIDLERRADAPDAGERSPAELIRLGGGLLSGLKRPSPKSETPLWSVNRNRLARTAIYRSRLAVKADAAQRVFSVRCSSLRWAIVDTGIDATHPAFRRRSAGGKPERSTWAGTRVVATYDFTRLRSIVSGPAGTLSEDEQEDLERRLERGRAIDWDALKQQLAVPHGRGYLAPPGEHGTHVAGIIGSDWRADDEAEMPCRESLVGICPDIELYDLRVFDGEGNAEEFAILAALQFIRHLNAKSDLQVIHGANLSLSLDHKLASYAVGRTPICDECERLMASGVMVVAAAGNQGQAKYISQDGEQHQGFRTVAITDPGNADGILTVGSTHRQDPHTYGVSYFSSKGPTGDGRRKPDLVAPGEKIAAPVPARDFKEKDGTSQAAAHASGVAAMLMARNPELVAQPRQVKEILCRSATDLGRERDFQGTGMIDALRALQAV
jgi:serine protease AprX